MAAVEPRIQTSCSERAARANARRFRTGRPLVGGSVSAFAGFVIPASSPLRGLGQARTS
jgi:hypothetical protein